MDALTFRPTTAQLRSLLFTTCASGIVAVYLMREHLAGHDGSDSVLGWGVVASALMLLSAWVTVAYSRAFTECTEGGIRVRGLWPERRWRWDQVRDISIRIGSRGITRTVMLTLTGGEQVLLGAPVTGGVMQDRGFDRKVDQIQQFWRRATGRDPDGAPVCLLPQPSYRVTARSNVVGLVTLAALGLTAALPVIARESGPALLVRLGRGQPGYFKGYFYSCSGSCSWIGAFTANDGSAHREGVTIAQGAIIPLSGGTVPAINTGAPGLVYPAGGGSGWIPLATILAVLAGCLTVYALWVRTRARQRRARDGRNAGYFLPAAWRAPMETGSHGSAFAGAACLLVGATVAAVLFLPLPSPAGSPAAARACADYSTWLATQNSERQPWTNQAALVKAVRVAGTGALGNDLSALAADVGAAAQSGHGSTYSDVAAEADVDLLNEMHAVSHECFGW